MCVCIGLFSLYSDTRKKTRHATIIHESSLFGFNWRFAFQSEFYNFQPVVAALCAKIIFPFCGTYGLKLAVILIEQTFGFRLAYLSVAFYIVGLYLYLVWFSIKKAYFTLVQHTLITVTSQTVSTESDSQTYGPFKMPHFFKQLNKKVKVIFQAASRVKNRAVSSAMPAANSSSFVRTLRNSFRRRKKPDVSLQTLYC